MKTMTQQIDSREERRRKGIRRTVIILAVVAFVLYVAVWLEHIFY